MKNLALYLPNNNIIFSIFGLSHRRPYNLFIYFFAIIHYLSTLDFDSNVRFDFVRKYHSDMIGSLFNTGRLQIIIHLQMKQNGWTALKSAFHLSIPKFWDTHRTNESPSLRQWQKQWTDRMATDLSMIRNSNVKKRNFAKRKKGEIIEMR